MDKRQIKIVALGFLFVWQTIQAQPANNAPTQSDVAQFQAWLNNNGQGQLVSAQSTDAAPTSAPPIGAAPVGAQPIAATQSVKAPPLAPVPESPSPTRVPITQPNP